MALTARATQDFVPIKEIRDGIMVLKDGGLRAILMASSINLSLKSADEQTAVIMQFQAFLNSIDFSIQIVIQSRRLDIKPYLILLENRMKEQVEPLLKIQTREYIHFIESFTETVNVMTKNFFIVIPYSPGALGSGTGVMGGLKGLFTFGKKASSAEEEADFAEKRSQIDQRMDIVQSGLSRVGVRTTPLGTEEVVELLYKTFNPGEIGGSIKLEQ